MPMISVSHRLSSSVLPFALTALLGLSGCAVKYDNKAGLTPSPVQMLWNTNGPAQLIVVGDETLKPTVANPTPIPPIPDPNNPLQTPIDLGSVLTSTPLSAAELNAVAVTPGTFVYTPAEGALLPSGVQTLSVTFTPKDTTNFSVTTRTVKINVSDVTSVTGQAGVVPESMQIVGGGYVNGVYFHPNQSNPSLLYARTDVGGAYRWVPSLKATKGLAPTCPGYFKSDLITPTAAKGNNGDFMQCGSWLPLLDFLNRANGGDLGVESLGLDPSDPQRLYLSTGLNSGNDPTQQNHFYISSDQGNTFTVVNAPFPINAGDAGRTAGERIAVDPNLGTTIFYGTRTAGLWKSMDAGLTWKPVTTFPVNAGKPAAGAGVVFVTFAPSVHKGTATQVLYAGVSDYNYYAADGSNNGNPTYSPIYTSTDAGATWLAVPGQTTYIWNSGGHPTNYNLTPIHGVVGPDGSLYVTYFSDEGPDQTHSGLLYSATTATPPVVTNPGIGAVYQFTPAAGSTGAGTWTNITPPSSVRIAGDEGGYSGLTLDAEMPGVIMVSSIDNSINGDAIYRSLNYGKTWTIVEQKLAGAINDASYAPWSEFGSQNLQVPTGKWPSALAIDPNDSNHAVIGAGLTLMDTQNLLATDILQQPIFNVGAYGSAPSGVKMLFGGSSIESAVVMAISSPAAGSPLLSAVKDLGSFVHGSTDASPVSNSGAGGQSVGPLFTTGTSVDFAQNLSLTVIRAGMGISGFDTATAPWYPDPKATPTPVCTTLSHVTNCLQVQIPQLLATSTTQGGQGGRDWKGIDTLWDYTVTPTVAGVTPSTKLSLGGGTVAIASDATTIVWATVDFPPACTGDGGTSWTAAVNGIIGAQVISDRVTPGKYYMYDSTSGQLLMGVATVSPVTSPTPFKCSLTFNTQTTLPPASSGQLTASFGAAGDIWLAVNASSNPSAGGLYRSTDSGKTLTKTGSFTQAYAVGLGSSATSSVISTYSKPSIYTVAIGASGYGFYRSIDNGATWLLVSNPNHLLGVVNQIVGDPNIFGRFYIGTQGRGIAYVDSK